MHQVEFKLGYVPFRWTCDSAVGWGAFCHAPDSISFPAKAKQSLHPFGVGKLAPDFSERDTSLTCPCPSNCMCQTRIFKSRRIRMHGASQKGLTNAVFCYFLTSKVCWREIGAGKTCRPTLKFENFLRKFVQLLSS